MQDDHIVSDFVQLPPGFISQLHLWNDPAVLELKGIAVLEYLVASENLPVGTSGDKVGHAGFFLQPEREGGSS